MMPSLARAALARLPYDLIYDTYDTLIQASELEASGAIDLGAGNAASYNPDGSIENEGSTGNLTFAAVKDTDYFAEEDKHNSMPWQSQSGSGHYTETLKLASIKAGKGLSANATGDIIVDIPELAPEPAAPKPPASNADNNDGQEHPPAQAAQKLTPAEEAAQAAKAAADKKEHDRQRLEDHIQKLASQPGQAWIGQLANLAKDKPDSVHLQQVAAAAKHWDYKAEGLTPEAAAVVVIVVTYFTAGTGSGVASTAGASATAATGSAAVGAAVTAGISTLAKERKCQGGGGGNVDGRRGGKLW